MKVKYLLFLLFWLYSCKEPVKKEKIKNKKNNLFSDETVVQIYKAKNNRKAKKLFAFLNSNNSVYKQYAAEAFASLQDTTAIPKLLSLLNDNDENVRIAAAFAISQTADSTIEKDLRFAVKNETNFKVQSKIIEAIGKCGGRQSMEWISGFNYDKNAVLMNGQAWAINSFMIRGIFSETAINKAMELIDTDKPESVRITASYFFSKIKTDLTKYAVKLEEIIQKENNTIIKMQLLKSFGRIKDPVAINLLRETIYTECDYRIKLSAIDALSTLPYSEVKEDIFNLLNNSNKNISTQASEYFVNKGIQADAEKYRQKAEEIKYHRAKANMLRASLKYSTDKKLISEIIKKKYNETKNIYEKKWLITALGEDKQNHEFIFNEMQRTKYKPVASTCMQTICNIHTKNTLTKEEEKKFAEYYKNAIEGGDVALTAQAATMIANPELKLNEIYENTFFLEQAVKNCKLASGIEAYVELKKAVEFVNGKKLKEPKLTYKNIDENKLQNIKENQRVIIKTTKGDFEIQLFFKKAPLTVLNFIELLKEDYYRGKIFHRIVPNFVAQVGCNRGDGWGSSDKLIRSEFSDIKYNESFVGMASAGKDTESTQWFITYSPAYHLNGRYTIFGKITKGMTVVHKLEAGDKIIDYKLINFLF